MSLLREAMEHTLASWGMTLDQEQWGLLDNYLQDVLEYNKKVNLTAAKSGGEIARRHFLDALAALPPLRQRVPEGSKLLDLGAGAGFIGICLQIAWPEASVTLMESSYRKFCFLNWASARLGLKRLRVLHERATREQRGLKISSHFDGVLARALAPLPEAIRLALPRLRPGGIFAVYQSDPPKALTLKGGCLEAVLPYQLPREDRPRHLVIIRKEVA